MRILGLACIVTGIAALSTHKVEPSIGWVILGAGVLLAFGGGKSGSGGRSGWNVDNSIIQKFLKK